MADPPARRARVAGEEVAERREVILEAAVHCLAELGYDRVRLRDVAKRAGVSIGLVQHYFETRDILLRSAFDHVSDSLIDQRTAAPDAADPWDRIVDLIDRLAGDPELRRHCVTWTQYCVIASREPSMHEGVAHIYAAWRRHLAEALEDGTRCGRFTPALAVEDVVDLLLTHIDGCELGIAAGVGIMTGARLRELALRTAALALGLVDEPLGRAPPNR
jgi:AcrR family transcriptional regulator